MPSLLRKKPLLETMILTSTQQAITRMVSDSTGFEWTNYNADERCSSRTLLLSCIEKAPLNVSQDEIDKAVAEGSMKVGKRKPYPRSKDFLLSLHDALLDDIWSKL